MKGGNDVIHKLKRSCLGLLMVDAVLAVKTIALTVGANTDCIQHHLNFSSICWLVGSGCHCLLMLLRYVT